MTSSRSPTSCPGRIRNSRSSPHGVRVLRTIFEPKAGLPANRRVAWACVEQCREAQGLDEADLSLIGEGVLDAAYVTDREILISDSIAHEGRFRFTCAHEPAHVLLHRKYATVFHETTELPDEQANQLERQASTDWATGNLCA